MDDTKTLLSLRQQVLEEKGLICRIPEEKDGRYKRIVFTEKAEEVREALRREIEESEAILLQGITPEEKKCFLETAGKMLKNLDERDDRHGKTAGI